MKKIFFTILFLLPFIINAQQTALEKFGKISSFELPLIDKTDMQINHDKIKITEADWLSFQLNKLEEFDPEFEYYVYGKVNVNGYDLLLIERRYTEEKNHWMVMFNADKYIAHLNIAYSNSEGFLYIESEIKPDQIIVKETNNLGDKSYSETTYSVNESGFDKYN